MREFFLFYWLCLYRAFPGAWAAAWISSAVFTIIGLSIGFIWKPFEVSTMNILVGLVPLAIFLAIMIAGPLVASFRIYREEVARRESAQRQRDEAQEQLRDKRDKAAIHAELDQLIGEGVDLRNKILESHQNEPPNAFRPGIEVWLQRAYTFVESHFSGYTGHFRSDAGLMSAGVYIGSSERSDAIKFLERRLARLGELLDQL